MLIFFFHYPRIKSESPHVFLLLLFHKSSYGDDIYSMDLQFNKDSLLPDVSWLYISLANFWTAYLLPSCIHIHRHVFNDCLIFTRHIFVLQKLTLSKNVYFFTAFGPQRLIFGSLIIY